MKSYFTTCSKSYEDGALSDNSEPLNAAGDKEEEGKDAKDGVENAYLDNSFNVEDENEVADEVEVVQDPVNLSAFESGQGGSEMKIQDDKTEVRKSSAHGVAIASPAAIGLILIHLLMVESSKNLMTLTGDFETSLLTLRTNIKFRTKL